MVQEEHRPVLIVEPDTVERELFGGALEAEGFQVLSCPGPTEPDYTCVGGRSGACPLVGEAAVVVLDMGLDSEALMTGTAAEELLGLYLTAGRPVVALGSHAEPSIDGQLIRLRRHVDEASVVSAVRALHRATRAAGAVGGPSSDRRPGGTE